MEERLVRLVREVKGQEVMQLENIARKNFTSPGYAVSSGLMIAPTFIGNSSRRKILNLPELIKGSSCPYKLGSFVGVVVRTTGEAIILCAASGYDIVLERGRVRSWWTCSVF